jgi:DNA-binding NarL/FixJ family response regulator
LRLTYHHDNVTALILQAKADKNMARDLTISEPTVRNHVRFACARAGVEGRIELVLRVIQKRDELRGHGI